MDSLRHASVVFRLSLGLTLGLGAASGCHPVPSRPASGDLCTGPACADAQPPLDDGCTRSRPVLTSDVVNARDLGDIPLAPAGSVACGSLFRGPPLAALTGDGCAHVAALGLRTVIDLREDNERAAQPDAACVTATHLNTPLPIPSSVSGSDYLADFDTDPSIALIFQTLADPASYPVYFHCTYGRDRTGVVATAILLALGASRNDVMTEYSLSAPTVGAFPSSLATILNEIDARGGIEAALRAKGITDAELAALRARAIALPGAADGG